MRSLFSLLNVKYDPPTSGMPRRPTSISTESETGPFGPSIVAVAAGSFDVQCGAGLLRVMQLQRPGGKRLAVADFLRGFDVKPGMAFEP